MKFLPPARPNLFPKLKIARSLVKFGTFQIWQIWHISDMPISILINVKNDFQAQIGSKIKNAQNLLKLGTFDISNMPISILMSKMIFIKYLPHVRPKLAPKLKVLRIYGNT